MVSACRSSSDAVDRSAIRQFYAKGVTLSAAPRPCSIDFFSIRFWTRAVLGGRIFLILQAGRSLHGTSRLLARYCGVRLYRCPREFTWSSNFTVALTGHAADAIPVLDGENENTAWDHSGSHIGSVARGWLESAKAWREFLTAGQTPGAAVPAMSPSPFGTNCTGPQPYHRLTLGMGSELMIRVMVVAAGAFTVAAVSALIFSY